VAARRAAVACVAAGLAWLGLIPATALSDTGFRRVMAGALVVLAVAWWLFGRLWHPSGARARHGFWLVQAGLVLAAAGAPIESGGLFVLGVFVLLVGGPTAAVALRRSGLPLWALALICFVGFGVLCGDLFLDAALAAAAFAYGVVAAGWIGLGTLLWRRPYAFSSTPT
jgi:hypothetical protein